jgi:hypothetical protein
MVGRGRRGGTGRRAGEVQGGLLACRGVVVLRACCATVCTVGSTCAYDRHLGMTEVGRGGSGREVGLQGCRCAVCLLCNSGSVGSTCACHMVTLCAPIIHAGLSVCFV